MLQLIALCALLVVGRARNVAGFYKAIKPRHLLVGKFQGDSRALHIRHVRWVKSLSGAKTYARFSLTDCGLLLCDLRLRLLQTNARVAVVQSDEHSAALYEASQVNAYGHDFAADRRSYVRLLVRSEAACGLEEARELAHDCCSGRDLNDCWRSSGLCVPVLRGLPAATDSEESRRN